MSALANAMTVASGSLFKNADPAAVEELLSHCAVRRLRSGEQLLYVDQKNDRLYVVLEGELQVLIGEPGAAVPITISPGQCAGEMSVIGGGPVSAPVIASADSAVLVIDVNLFWGVMEQAPAIARNLLKLLAERMRKTNEALASSLQQSRAYEQWAHIDALTGIYNRRWLEQMLPRYLERARRDGEPFALGLFDLDHFKRYNDRHGHIGGDAALRATVNVVREHIRPSDQIARYGGEEFCLLAPGTDLAKAQVLGERLVRVVAQNAVSTSDGAALASVTISLGLAVMGADHDAEGLLEAADQALYRAKHGGRNRVST